MSIEYNTEQWEIDNLYGVISQSKPTNKIHGLREHKRSRLPKSDYTPFKLIRVSDMVIVDGSQVEEGYCALSYSWLQSAEIKVNEAGWRKRVDMGKHRIVYPGRTIRENPSGRKEIISAKTKLVKFEGLIQRICKDFGISYIWYDQICIDQDDWERKQFEIKWMHRIFAKACFVVALIPELEYVPSRDDSNVRLASMDAFAYSQWNRRIWTLEEAYMARKILFIGRNAFMWSSVVSHDPSFGTRAGLFLYTICNKTVKWTASTVLFNAHIRQSTMKHDRVFALINMFPEITNQLVIDYKQPIQDLMIEFYGALAKIDISVLCFGTHLYYQDVKRDFDTKLSNSLNNDNHILEAFDNKVPIKEFDLPTWTGASGEHIPAIHLQFDFQNYRVIGRHMYLTSTSISVSLKNALNYMKETQTKRSYEDYQASKLSPIWSEQPYRLLYVDILPTATSIPFFSTTDEPIGVFHHESIGEYHVKATHILPAQKKDGFWITTSSSSTLQQPHVVGAYLSLTEVCKECEILTGIQFELYSQSGFVIMPVVRQEDAEHYKSIGVCIIGNRYKLSNSSIERGEKTFKIC